LAYFSGIFSLQQMVNHIYGRTNILNTVKRSHMFINELGMYVTYLKNEIEKNLNNLTTAKQRQLKTFQQNLLKGIAYYHSLSDHLTNETSAFVAELKLELDEFQNTVTNLIAEVKTVA